MRLHVYVCSLELALPIEIYIYIKKYRNSIAGIRETFEVYCLMV